MEEYIITGGTPLRGEASAGGSKNAVLPLLAACVLVKDRVELTGCPVISDIENMLTLLESLGCSTSRQAM